MADIFISKSSKDDEFAFSVVKILEKSGISCWISNRDLRTKIGELYAKDIVDAIISSNALLLILSNHSNKSRHVINEVSTACDHGKKVFALQIDNVVPTKEFDYYLSQEQRIIDTEILTTGDFKNLVTHLLEYLNTQIKLNTSFIDDDYYQRINYKKLKRETQEKRLSYSLSIAHGNEDEYDNYHFYKSIVRLDVVDSQKNYWSSYRYLKITNNSEVSTSHIVHKECGESKSHFRDMRVRAYLGNINGERLIVESKTEVQPNLIQVFRINFRKPLKPGESINIFYRLDWPNEPSSYCKDELSQSISLSRYRKGVGRLEFGVFEPYEILSSYVMEVSKMNERKNSNVSIQYIPINDEPYLMPLHNKQFFGIKCFIENPVSILYQILYKIDTKEEDDEYLF